MKKHWWSERLDGDEGEITYEAHGYVDDNPELSSLVIFEGPNAKAECDAFIALMEKQT